MASSKQNGRELPRHTLVDVNDPARQRILAGLCQGYPCDDTLQQNYARVLLPQAAGARIPGIVRRHEEPLAHDHVAVGFCSPNRGSQGRLRLAALVPREDVIQVTSPYDLLAGAPALPPVACSKALALCRDQARALGLELGVWGSAALELYTGLPYTDRHSDLDLLVMPAPAPTLSRFLDTITAIEGRYDLRIDAELELSSGFGVHLKELFGQGRTILGKSRTEVSLLGREQVLEALPPELPDGARQAVEGGCWYG